jgi:hypothetical protein
MFGGYSGGYAGSYPAVQSYPTVQSYPVVQSYPWPQTVQPQPAPRASTTVVRRTLCVLPESLEQASSFAVTYHSLRDPAAPRHAAK